MHYVIEWMPRQFIFPYHREQVKVKVNILLTYELQTCIYIYIYIILDYRIYIPVTNYSNVWKMKVTHLDSHSYYIINISRMYPSSFFFFFFAFSLLSSSFFFCSLEFIIIYFEISSPVEWNVWSIWMMISVSSVGVIQTKITIIIYIHWNGINFSIHKTTVFLHVYIYVCHFIFSFFLTVSA